VATPLSSTQTLPTSTFLLFPPFLFPLFTTFPFLQRSTGTLSIFVFLLLCPLQPCFTIQPLCCTAASFPTINPRYSSHLEHNPCGVQACHAPAGLVRTWLGRGQVWHRDSVSMFPSVPFPSPQARFHRLRSAPPCGVTPALAGGGYPPTVHRCTVFYPFSTLFLFPSLF